MQKTTKCVKKQERDMNSRSMFKANAQGKIMNNFILEKRWFLQHRNGLDVAICLLHTNCIMKDVTCEPVLYVLDDWEVRH